MAVWRASGRLGRRAGRLVATGRPGTRATAGRITATTAGNTTSKARRPRSASAPCTTRPGKSGRCSWRRSIRYPAAGDDGKAGGDLPFEAGPPNPLILTMRQLDALPPPEWLVQGLIPEKSLVVPFGPPKGVQVVPGAVPGPPCRRRPGVVRPRGPAGRGRLYRRRGHRRPVNPAARNADGP